MGADLSNQYPRGDRAMPTNLAWLTLLGVTVAGFPTALERQDRKLELLLEHTSPSSGMR